VNLAAVWSGFIDPCGVSFELTQDGLPFDTNLITFFDVTTGDITVGPTSDPGLEGVY
jgi:hypothetical protein